jgi:hypothetical protein
MGIGAAVGRSEPRIELWDQLVSEVAETKLARICVSDEDFARADDAAIDRILTGLGGDRLHLVYVARRIDKLLPSHWQERIKAGMTWSYADFLEQMLREQGAGWEWHMMWDAQSVGAVVDRWAHHLDRDRITVIVADETDRATIPRAFEQLLGLDEGFLIPPDQRSNRSLGFAEAEAVRRVNRVFAEHEWGPEAYWRIVQNGIATRLKDAPCSDGVTPIPGLTASALRRVADLADQQADEIRVAGIRVIGDPETLRIRETVQPDRVADAVDVVSMELLASAVEGAVIGALDLQARVLGRQPAVRRNLADVGGRELLGMLRRRLATRLKLHSRAWANLRSHFGTHRVFLG